MFAKLSPAKTSQLFGSVCAIFARSVAKASLSFSIKYICLAPRLNASSPIEPLPEKTSTKEESTISN
jgi:hypothetical protein